MKWVLYLLWLLALPFILLVIVYEKILHCIYWVMDIDDEPRTQRNHKGKTDGIDPQTTDKQRINITADWNEPDDDGMNPQERTLPYITPEPVKPPEPKKEKPTPKIIFKYPERKGNLKIKKTGRESRNMGRE